MTLGFSTHINGRPTHFVEKIWKGIWNQYTQEYWDYFADELNARDCALHNLPIVSLARKIHSIRADPKNKWKVGNKIHFVIHNRTPNRFQFAPVLNCVSIQRIEIKWVDEFPIVWIDDSPFSIGFANKNIRTLAQNDGFDSVRNFFKWFSSDFSGKIIHWTDHQY